MNRIRLFGAIAFLLFAEALLVAKGGFLMFAGGPLARPVIMDAPEQLARFNRSYQVRRQPDPDSLKGRPYLEVSFFAGPAWEVYFRDGGRVENLRPEQAAGHGRFYPALGSAPAILEMPAGKPSYISLSDDGLQLLTDLGVPVRLNP
jgi:hypothetical protein